MVNIASYSYLFKIHTTNENILKVFSYLKERLVLEASFASISALDPNLISAYRQIFQAPSYLLIIVLIFCFATLYLNASFNNPYNNSIIQRFALLSLVRNPKKALVKYRLLEATLSLSLFFILIIPLFFVMIIIDPRLIIFPVESIKLAGLFFGIYFSIIVIHTLFENYRLKNVQLSKLYRHPE